tara:strand:+ start:204 stop:446 length:243 start_codon:yes stop_codon:yes gene_type:complete
MPHLSPSSIPAPFNSFVTDKMQFAALTLNSAVRMLNERQFTLSSNAVLSAQAAAHFWNRSVVLTIFFFSTAASITLFTAV